MVQCSGQYIISRPIPIYEIVTTAQGAAESSGERHSMQICMCGPDIFYPETRSHSRPTTPNLMLRFSLLFEHVYKVNALNEDQHTATTKTVEE